MINFIAGFNVFCISGLEDKTIKLIVKIRILCYQLRIMILKHLQNFISRFQSNSVNSRRGGDTRSSFHRLVPQYNHQAEPSDKLHTVIHL